MIKGLKTAAGANVPFEEIQPVRDANVFGVSPATLAYLKHDSTRRSHLKGGVSASQWGKGLRQLWLEATAEVYVGAHDSIAALMGTAKHAHILTEGLEKEHIETEIRMYSEDRRISGQADQIVYLPGATAEIWDAKTGKKYSLKMYREEIDTHGYTYQMNLLADLHRLEYPEITISRLAIEWLPSDAGRGDPSLEIIEVPMWEPGRAMAAFTVLADRLSHHIESGIAPTVCTPDERWERFDKREKRIVQIKCEEYCPFLEVCRATSASIDEVHPTDGSNV